MDTKTYLDYNATAPLRPEARRILLETFETPHNASSVHSFGREGRKLVERAREQIAALVGAPATQIIFNSGATEGNNTVLGHFKGERVLISAIEHSSVLEAAPGAPRIPVTPEAIIDLNALEDLLKREKTALVSIMLVNNETGTIQPVKEAAALAHEYGALFHCDGVQAAGRTPVNMPELGIDFLTLSSHKIGGPQGAGALVLGLCGETPTLLRGGGQERHARAGTENVAGIAGFGSAAAAALTELTDHRNKTAKLQHQVEEYLTSSGGIVIHGQNTARVTNTTFFSVPGASSETLLMALDLENIAVSNGSACSSGRIEISHVLKAMNINEETAKSAIRLSTGWNTQQEDIDRFLEVWQNIYQRIKDKTKTDA